MAARKVNNDFDTFEGQLYSTNDKRRLHNEYYLDGNAVRNKKRKTNSH